MLKTLRLCVKIDEYACAFGVKRKVAKFAKKFSDFPERSNVL